jgi:hypothetical protein
MVAARRWITDFLAMIPTGAHDANCLNDAQGQWPVLHLRGRVRLKLLDIRR